MLARIKNIYYNITVTIKYYLVSRWIVKAKGNQLINQSMTMTDYENFAKNLYGNEYIRAKYKEDAGNRIANKRFIVELVDKYLNIEQKAWNICDAGANRGYLMAAFMEKSLYRAFGFDILEDLTEVIDSKDDKVRKHFKIGSILDIPSYDNMQIGKFDVVVSCNVFEHIPINMTDIMVNQLLQLKPKFFVLEISRDVFSDGHITLKGTNFWVKKFKGYRVMKELGKELKRDIPEYKNCGIPRNGWNKCPGIIFLERDLD